VAGGADRVGGKTTRPVWSGLENQKKKACQIKQERKGRLKSYGDLQKGIGGVPLKMGSRKEKSMGKCAGFAKKTGGGGV